MAIKWSEARNVFVNFERSKNGFYYCVSNFTNSYIISYLLSHGIESQQYIDNVLGSSVEIVDDLITMGENSVVFYVSNENLRLVSIITNLIKEEEEDIKIIWIGEIDKSIISNSIDVEFDAFVYENYENNIFWLIENSKECWGNLHGVEFNKNLNIKDVEFKLDKIELNKIESVYKSNVVSLKDALTMGILLGKRVPNTESDIEFRNMEDILEEFTLISNANQDKEQITLKLVCDNLFDFPQWKELMENFIKCNDKLKFEIAIYADDLSENMLEILKDFNVRKIMLVVRNENHINEIRKNVTGILKYKDNNLMEYSLSVDSYVFVNCENIGEFLHEMIIENEIIKIGMLHINQYNQNNKCLNEEELNKVILNEKNCKLMCSIDKVNQVKTTEYGDVFYYEIPLLNGLIALKTGNYNQLKGTDVKHVIVSEEILNGDLYNSLKEFTSINSAIYVVNNKEIKSDYNNLYLEDTSAIKVSSNYFSNNIKTAQENNYFLSHLHLVESTEEDNKKILHLNNYKRNKQIELSERCFIDKEKIQEAKNNSINFIAINSKEDLESFIEEADYFNETGKIDKSSILDKYLVNICRWSHLGACMLNYIPRMQISNEGEIYPCIDCHESLGNIKQPQYEIVKKTYEKREREIIQRKCNSCPIEKKCAKCVMIPSFMTREEYCSLRKEKPYIHDYIVTMSIINYMYKNSSLLRNIDLSQVRITNNSSYYLTKNIKNKDEENYIFPIIIIYIKDDIILWSPVFSKFYKITHDLAFITELMLKNLSPTEIIEIIQEEFNMSNDESTKCFRQAYDILHRYGCLSRHIKF